jgi:hypothetical protein
LRDGELGEETFESLHVAWILGVLRAIGGIVVPPVDEDHEQHGLGRVLDPGRGDRKLSAIPKVALFIELHKGEPVIVARHGLIFPRGRLLPRELLLVNAAGDALETIGLVGDTARQKRENDEAKCGAK